MNEATKREQQDSTLRRFRLWFGNVPLLSLLVWRWQVVCGSEVIDYGATWTAAERRALRWAYGNARRWNMTTVVRTKNRRQP